MEKKIIFTDKTYPALGPYSQATEYNGVIYVSGQLGMDSTATLLDGVEAQTKKALENMALVLEKAGSSMDKVLKTTILLGDINDFTKVNEIYATFFPSNPPARSTFEVGKLPKNASIEIECIACK